MAGLYLSFSHPRSEGWLYHEPVSSNCLDQLPLVLPLSWRIDFKLAVIVYQCLHGLAPSYLADEFHHPADTLIVLLTYLFTPNGSLVQALMLLEVHLFVRRITQKLYSTDFHIIR